MSKIPKCAYCKNDAVWAMQFIGEDAPTFYVLGWHMRGFKVTKVCDECKERIKAQHELSSNAP